MLRRRYIVAVALLIVVLNFLFAACTSSASNGSQSTLGTPGAYTCVRGNITASGSTALAPLVQAVAEKYQAKCSGSTITVNLGGSKTGLANAEEGASTIGNSDLFADKKTQADLFDHQVAVVPFAVIINPQVGVKSLTTTQLKKIYSGQATNWKQIGGPDMQIAVVTRPTTSGTRATFQQYVLGGAETIPVGNLSSDTTGTVIQDVAQNPGAIGYAATFPAQKSGDVVVAAIDGHASTKDLVKDNTYHFWNIEHMYTRGTAKNLAQALIDYMASPDGKAAIASLGFISISDIDPATLQTRQPAH